MNTAIVTTTKNEVTTAPTFDTSILAGQVSPSTAEQYKMHFGAYSVFAGSFENATQPSTLAQWRQSLYEDGYTLKDGTPKTYSVNAINQRIAAIRSVMSEASQQGFIPSHVADAFKGVKGLSVKANKERRKSDSRTKISREQMDLLMAAPDKETPAGVMNYALLMVMRYSGLRVSEIVGIKSSDIEWVTNDEGASGWAVSVMGKNMTEAEQRELGVKAYEAIQEWLAVRGGLGVASEHVFTGFVGRGSRNPSNKPLTRQGAWYIAKRYADALGLDGIKPHDFRRYVGTQLAKKDIRLAQKQLGHKRIETTAQNYVLDDVQLGNVDLL